MQGSPSGVDGRWPIHSFTRSAGRSRGSPGQVRSAKSRSTSARFQFGAAASPASSTWPGEAQALRRHHVRHLAVARHAPDSAASMPGSSITT